MRKTLGKGMRETVWPVAGWLREKRGWAQGAGKDWGLSQVPEQKELNGEHGCKRGRSQGTEESEQRIGRGRVGEVVGKHSLVDHAEAGAMKKKERRVKGRVSWRKRQ
eukprot:1265769-Pleurochrysis_carterae.AAC.1